MNKAVSTDHRIALSSALQNVPKSATLAINEKSKQLQLEGKDVIRLGLGQSPFPVPDIMIQNLREYASAKDYMAVQGYLPLREAITAFINRTELLQRKAEDVIIGPGSKELLFGLQMVMDCDLVLPAPSWVSYEPQAKLLGKKVHWLTCRAEDGWKDAPLRIRLSRILPDECPKVAKQGAGLREDRHGIRVFDAKHIHDGKGASLILGSDHDHLILASFVSQGLDLACELVAALHEMLQFGLERLSLLLLPRRCGLAQFDATDGEPDGPHACGDRM